MSNINYEALVESGTLADVAAEVEKLKETQIKKCNALTDAIGNYYSDMNKKGDAIKKRVDDLLTQKNKIISEKNAMKQAFVQSTIIGDQDKSSEYQDEIEKADYSISMLDAQINTLLNYEIVGDEDLFILAQKAMDELTDFLSETRSAMDTMSVASLKVSEAWRTSVYKSDYEKEKKGVLMESKRSIGSFEKMKQQFFAAPETAAKFIAKREEMARDEAERQKKLEEQRRKFEELDSKSYSKEEQEPAKFRTYCGPDGTRRQRYDKESGSYVDMNWTPPKSSRS